MLCLFDLSYNNHNKIIFLDLKRICSVKSGYSLHLDMSVDHYSCLLVKKTAIGDSFIFPALGL